MTRGKQRCSTLLETRDVVFHSSLSTHSSLHVPLSFSLDSELDGATAMADETTETKEDGALAARVSGRRAAEAEGRGRVLERASASPHSSPLPGSYRRAMATNTCDERERAAQVSAKVFADAVALELAASAPEARSHVRRSLLARSAHSPSLLRARRT